MSASRRPVDVAHAEQLEKSPSQDPDQARRASGCFLSGHAASSIRRARFIKTGDRTLLQELAPTQDDIWFKAISLKQKTPCLAIGGDKLMPLIGLEDKSRLWSRMRAETMGYGVRCSAISA